MALLSLFRPQVKHRERSSNALVMGSKIRYVHLPDSVNVVAVSACCPNVVHLVSPWKTARHD